MKKGFVFIETRIVLLILTNIKKLSSVDEIILFVWLDINLFY